MTEKQEKRVIGFIGLIALWVLGYLAIRIGSINGIAWEVGRWFLILFCFISGLVVFFVFPYIESDSQLSQEASK